MSLAKDVERIFSRDKEHPPRHPHEDLLASLLVMAWMVEARDPYTGGHLWRVSQFSRLLATEAGLPPADVARIAVGGYLHDLGKVSVPDPILRKAGPLTADEYAIIKTHPNVGWRLLAGHPLATLAEAAVRAHHETPDGRGYPRGLAGAAVPVDARIVGICDAFDAMTSTRPYRRGMPASQALSIIEENLDRQFDRAFGTRFLALGRAGALDPIVTASLRPAAVVGTLLNSINQGGALIDGRPLSWFHIVLNYLVPYCVASYSTVRNEPSRQEKEPA